MMKVIGYIRVSTEDQARDGVSLAAQEERIKAYCTAHELELVHVYRDEGVSGTVSPSKRPGLAAALGALRDGEAGGLVVLRLDRLTRSVRDLLDLVDTCRREEWALHSVTDRLDTETPMGRFVLTILGAVSQLERDMISMRTTEALAEKKRQGCRIGAAPYGWRLATGPDGKLTALEPVPEEQQVISMIRERIAAGCTQQGAATWLNTRGYRSRTGGEWSRRGVQCALASEVE